MARDTLTPAQHRAIEALMINATVKDAAKAAGISRSTLHNWLNDSTFLDTLKNAESELLAGVSRQLATITARSLSVLSDVLNDDKATTGAKLRAIEIALSKFAPLRDMLTVEARLQALEKRNVKH